MDNAAVIAVPGWTVAVFALVLVAVIGVWGMILARLHAGRSLVPFEPRRVVPWTMSAALLILLFYFASQAVISRALLDWIPGASESRPAAEAPEKERDEAKSHPAARLMHNAPPSARLVCAALVALVVPACEEFVFRLALQGALEAAVCRLRRRSRQLRPWLPMGALPIGVPAVFFAALHLRGDATVYPWQHDFAVIVGTGIAGLATLAFGVALLRGHFRAALYDLGIVPHKLWADARLGGLAFLAIMFPIYLTQFGLSRIVPAEIGPDPITLFFFAIALGWLYFRTHRIVPAVVLHMCLNSTSIAMAFLLQG